MKKILLLTSLLFVIPCIAQPQTDSNEGLDIYTAVYKQQQDLLKIQNILLEALLKVPFDKRVYVYPALFESQYIAKKIVTHPQIAIWKGKKPTQIAPQMQEYAKENLEFMPAKLYPLLDPDAWPKMPQKEDWRNIQKMIPEILANPNQTQNIP